MRVLLDHEIAGLAATADRLARQMGGRFVTDPAKLADFRAYRAGSNPDLRRAA